MRKFCRHYTLWKGELQMKLISTSGAGMVRIDFDPNMVRNEKYQDIYDYFESQASTSKIIWKSDALLLKRGVIEGRYNKLITTDLMAEKACRNAEKFIKSCEKD